MTRLLLDMIEEEQRHRLHEVGRLYDEIDRLTKSRWDVVLLAGMIGGVVGGIVGAWVR